MTQLKQRKIRILHVFGRMDRGGAELRTLDLVSHADRERFEFHFCTLSGNPGELDTTIQQLGAAVHPCKLDFRFPWRFRRLLRELDVDVVHSHVHQFSGLILALASKERRLVRIAHFRSTGDGKPSTTRRKAQKALMRFLIDRYATDILAVSEGAMVGGWSEHWRVDPRCQVIYNGFAMSTLSSEDAKIVKDKLGIPSDALLVAHVGRFIPEKNHIRLVGIFRRLLEDAPGAVLVLVGRGGNDHEQTVRLEVTDLALKDQILFLGERQDVTSILRAADIMVFPSMREGLPGAVIEACSQGTPVIASDIPGVKEVAERLPFVKCLSLSESDEQWAKTCLNIVSEARSRDARSAMPAALMASDFSMVTSLNLQQRIWSGSR